ncbi:MAG: YggT family protein [Rhodospirillales bacterium]|nr:YggT family protein [Rhodospirillales bacterium]
MNVVLIPLIQVASLAIEIYMWMLVAMAILSWLIAFDVINRHNNVVSTLGRFLWKITEPPLRPIRRILPDLGGIDISPMILLLGLYFLRSFLLNLAAYIV